jgi:ABC-type transport system involved in Fe-S cluster assembly fused permease/ATPase subunit
MTSISIAHRLSTIEDADKIILMKDGKIIEEGTYINLIELRGQFFKLSVGK